MESFTLKYWVKHVCVRNYYGCFTFRTFLFKSLALDFCVCATLSSLSVAFGLLLPFTVSEICERSAGPGTDLDLGDICMLMSSVQFSTENRHGIRATFTF